FRVVHASIQALLHLHFPASHVAICCTYTSLSRSLRLYPLGAMLCSNNIIRYQRRSSKGFAGTQLEFRSFEVRGLMLYRPAAKHYSSKILKREHRSFKGFAGTHVKLCCIHSVTA